MVGSRRATSVADDDEQLDTRALIRLAVWGVAALVSVVVVVVATRSDLGAKRFSAGLIAIATPPDEAAPPAVQLLARAAHAEREARRAVETAIALSADRERMATRVMALEQELGEIHGSVTRAVTLATEGRSTAPIFSTSSSGLLAQYKTIGPAHWSPTGVAPAVTATDPPSEPQRVAVAPAPPPRPGPAPGQISPQPIVPPMMPSSAQPPAPALIGAPQTIAPALAPEAPAASRPHDTPAVTGSTAPDGAPVPKVEFGVDLGPGTTLGRLKTRWKKLAAERPDLVRDMRPLVTIRDLGGGKPVELRLVAGPLANVHLATEFCTSLASQQHVCRPAVFDGQRLNVQ